MGADGSYTRVGRPSWLSRLLGSGNRWDALDIFNKHESYLEDLYEIAEDEGWRYEEKTPIVEVAVEGESRQLDNVSEIKHILDLDNSEVANTTYEQNLVSEDEFGPINNLTLLYQSHNGRRYGEEEAIAAIVEVEEMDRQLFDRLIGVMESHYGDSETLPYRFMPDPGV